MLKRAKQLTLGGEEIQLERALKHSRIEVLNEFIDWEIFRATLEKRVRKENYDKGGRPPYDVIIMLKIIILQHFNGNLSNDKTEEWLNCRLDWILFLRLTLGEALPDSNTIRNFKEALGSEGMKELFDLLNAQLLDEGIIMKCGTINDGSFVDVPRRRTTTKDENESLKNGEVPDSLKPIENPQTDAEKAHNNRVSQIDTDATWAKKGEETHFGYKAHPAIDEKSKIVTEITVTTASTHDVVMFVYLVCLNAIALGLDAESAFTVFVDSGYTGEKHAELLKEMFPLIQLLVCKKATKNKPLTDLEKAYNHAISTRRCRGEHVFGSITNDMGGMRTSCIGLERNTRDIVGKFLAYNLKRAVFLRKKKIAAAA